MSDAAHDDGEVSMALLRQMIETVAKEADAGHARLRRDFDKMLDALAKVAEWQREDHSLIVKQEGHVVRQRELSTNRAVVIAAAIGGGCQILVILLGWIGELLRRWL